MTIDTERTTVTLETADGKPRALTLQLSENDDDSVTLRIDEPSEYSGLAFSAADFFSALADLRTRMEKDGLHVRCAGSCRDVYPSGMARSMGAGRKAYRLKRGAPARTADLVDIF